jgi:cobalt/nickel transport system permease protein
MEVRFRLPPLVASPIARLDARWRLVGVVLACVAVCLLHQPLWAGIALILAFALAWSAAMPWGWLLARLALLGGMLAIYALALPFLSRLSWEEGFSQAAVIVERGLALGVLAAVLLVTAPVDETLRAAAAIGVPGLLVRIGLLAWRYLFLLADELDRLRTALRVRGFRNQASAHAWNTVAAATGTLLVRGSERAERVAAAMRCRGFDGTLRGLDEHRTTWADVLFVVGVVGIGAAMVRLDWTW